MNWNDKYKYRIVGRAVENNGETMLIFFLDSFTKIVPLKADDDGKKKAIKKTKRKFKDGELPKDISLPAPEEINFENANLSNLPSAMKTDVSVASAVKTGVIYFDEKIMKDESALTLEDLGEERYSAERISHMIERGLEPAEGWEYLKGMAVVGKNSLTIFPESWADSFGDKASNTRDGRLQAYLNRVGPIVEGTPYGWTVGLELPTMEKVQDMIDELKSSA